MAMQAGCTERESNAQMLKLGFAQANLLSLIWGQIQLTRHRQLQFKQLHLHQTLTIVSGEKRMFLDYDSSYPKIKI